MSLSQFISLKTKVGNSYILRYIICSKSRLNGDTERCSFLKRVSKVRKKTQFKDLRSSSPALQPAIQFLWCRFGEFDIRSTNIPLSDIFLLFSALVCMILYKKKILARSFIHVGVKSSLTQFVVEKGDTWDRNYK